MRSRRAQIRQKFYGLPRLRFEAKQELTSMAGLVVVQALLGVLRLPARLCVAVGAPKRVYGLQVVFLLLVVHLLAGYRRLADMKFYREDPLMLRILGLRCLPAIATVSRTLGSATSAQVDGVRKLSRDIVLDRLKVQALRRVTLDYDGSVQSTCGHGEGTAVGYNKRKKGARSYWPLFTTVAQTGQFLDVLHRPGNVSDSSGATDLMREHVALLASRLCDNVQLEARWDSAFFSEAVVELLDAHSVEFAGSVPFKRFQPLKEAIASRQRWRPIDERWSFFEMQWKPAAWAKRQRFVIYRQRTWTQRKGPVQLDLFEPDETTYQYKVVVTNKAQADATAEDVLHFHNGRGAQEKVFGEAKQHAGLDVVLGKRLHTNQLFTLAGMMAHNLGRELQMQTDAPVKKDEPKNRTPRWLFQTLGTLSARMIRRAAKVVSPQGRLTLALNANKAVEKEFRRRLEKLERRQELAA